MFTCSRRALCAIVVLLTCLAAPAVATEGGSVPPPPHTTMEAGILFELESGSVLWAHNEDVIRAPASLTKVLTGLVVMENAGLDEPAVLSTAARNVAGQRMFAEEGWVMSVSDMLWGLLLQSGNDAAIALAETVSPDGTVAGFMDLANRRAFGLGATRTNFVNPHGLDEPGHQTTARDLALITAEAMRNPTFAGMTAAKTKVVPWAGDRDRHLFINHNKLLWNYPDTVGGKTGYTRGAGNCLISAVQRGGSTLIAVVMGTPHHYAESTALYDWGFAHLETLRANSADFIQPQAEPEVSADVSAVPQAHAAMTLASAEQSSPGVHLVILIPAWGIVCLVAIAIFRRFRFPYPGT